MSDTPETDAKASPHIGFYSCATVPAEFSRKLERERNVALEQWELCIGLAKKNERERDEARARVEIITPSKNNPVAEFFSSSNTPETDKFKIKFKTSCGEKYWVPVEHSERLERERDEAREALENHMASTVHSCSDECKRPMCVLRRQRDDAREMVKAICKNKFGTNCEFIDSDE